MKRCATKSGIKAAALTVLSVLLLSACEDQRRIVWTADGSLAAVIAGDGLRICDAQGGLGEPRPGVELVEWFPDGRKVLAVEYEKIDTWSKVRDNETASDLKTAIDTAAQILLASRKSQGDWKRFEKSVEHLPHTREAVIYLRENKDKDMTASFGESWTKVKNQVDVGVHHICSYELSNKSLVGRKELFKTMRDVKGIRLSPRGKSFLLVYKPEQSERYTLAHVSNTGAVVSTVSGAAAIYPDWSKDGSSIYFIEAAGEAVSPPSGEPVLGSLCALSVDSDSESIKMPFEKRILSRVVFHDRNKIRAVADGGIIFSSAPMHFPGCDSQILSRHALFAVRPKESAMVVRVMPVDEPDAGGDLMDYFEVSPSGKFISIPSSKEGTTIYSALTGSCVRVSGDGFRWSKRLTFVPTWRNEDELCLGLKADAEPSNEEVNEVVLWSVSRDKGRSISGNWPEAARKGLLY